MRYNIVFHPSWWHQHGGIDFSRPFWEEPDIRIAADVAMRRLLYQRFGAYGLGEEKPSPRPLIGSDLLACGFLSSQIMGCRVDFLPDAAPQVHCANLDDDAVFALEAPDFDKNPVWQGVQRQLDYLQSKFGRVETYIDVNGVQNLALDLRGQALFLDYFDEDSPARHLLEVCCRTTLTLCRRLAAYSPCISGGVSNIVEQVLPEVLLHSNCSVEMISERTYEAFLLEHDQHLSQAFPVYGIHHCGQSTEHVIRAYARVANLRLIEVGAFSDLEKVVAALDESVLVNARYSPVRLRQVDATDMHKEIMEMTRILPGRRLSISCVGIDADVPDEQVKQFLAYCRELLPD